MFRKENYTELNQFFLNTNWINILEGKSIGENVQAFNGVLAGRQITYSKSKNKKYPLFFQRHNRMYKLKNEMHTKFKIYGCNCYSEQFRIL